MRRAVGLWVAAMGLVLGGAGPGLAVCGDNVLEPPAETCDDGNLTGGDGCSATCQLENHAPACDTAMPSIASLWPPNKNIAGLVRVLRARLSVAEAEAATSRTVPGFAGRPAIVVLAFQKWR